MAEIIKRSKALAVNPLKVSHPVGASLAFLGINKAIPMMHGSQGCAAFGKVFFVRHFREPIPLQTTAMDQVATVLSSDDNVIQGLKTIAEKSKPALIGLPTTGLSETQGTDIRRLVREFREQYPEFNDIPVVPVSTPDFVGCLESGYALAVKAIIEYVAPEDTTHTTRVGKRRKQVNVLAGAMLTPGDLEHVKELIEAFGLRPVVLPDYGDALSDLVAGMGCEVVAAVAPSKAPILESVPTAQVKLGDLEDLEMTIKSVGANLIISNSHAVDTARRLGLPLYRAGFPQYGLIGGYQRLWVGYRGTRQSLFDLANIMVGLGHGEIAPYRSVYAVRPGDTPLLHKGENLARKLAASFSAWSPTHD